MISKVLISKITCVLFQFNTMEEEDIDMETVHDSQAFIHHHLNLLERPSTPGKRIYTHKHNLVFVLGLFNDILHSVAYYPQLT